MNLPIALILFFLPITVLAAEWNHPVPPLPTRWSKDVTPETAHREYPRPQMTRDRWLSLNGLWEFGPAEEKEPPPIGRALDGRILVPFPVESALSGVAKRHHRVWYRRTFTLPPEWAGQRVLLHFEAANWEASVFVNGRPTGSHRGGYDPFSFDITGALKQDGPQELVVGVYNPADAGEQPRGKQVNQPDFMTFYTANTGLWQSVWLEPVPEAHIEDIVVTPDVDSGTVRLCVESTVERGHTIDVGAYANGRRVATATGRAGDPLTLSVPEPILWTPDRPFLYELKVSLLRDGKAVDRVGSYFGMRKVSVQNDGKWPRIMLNDRFLFQVGLLDQGYWPDGLYSAPTDEALRYDIEITKRLGFNMIRKHVKVEPRRWYYWADKLGILVWQDMPFGTFRTPESRTQYAVELRRMIETLRRHPSIIMWVTFNERYGQHDTEQVAAWVKRFDPTRLVNSASGGADVGVGDMYDAHSYPAPNSEPATPPRASVVGEFGGLGFVVPDHLWTEKVWSYHLYTNVESLTRRYENLLHRAWTLKDEIGLSAVVYTQTTDVEAELNGLLTYDRAVQKMDPARVRSANRGEYRPKPFTMVLSNAEKEPVEWRYTTDAPAEDWTQPGFDASHWKTGRGGFGTPGTLGSTVNTPWTTRDIWLRREFTLEKEPPESLVFLMHHDEDVEVYINGVLAATGAGYTTDYEEFSLSPEGRAALRIGRNTIAVHCRNLEGGQNIDVGLGYPS